MNVLGAEAGQLVTRTIHAVFANAAAAEYLVAGLPAAARVLAALAQAHPGAALSCDVGSGRWTPSPRCQDECARLCEHVSLGLAAPAQAEIVDGMAVLDQLVRTAEAALPPAPWSVHNAATDTAASAEAALQHADRVFLLATAKPRDGIVSRYLNRPVSRTITRLLVRLEPVRPGHATVATAILAITMLAALIFLPEHGAAIGAVLYQAASIVDGVDGEMARATFRTSNAGARLDSLIDAATNLLFFGGLAVHLWLRGDYLAAWAGFAGMALLLAGLLQIGVRAQRLGQPINFEVVKVHLRRDQSEARPKGSGPSLTDILIWLTMRDFIALFVAVLALAGFARWVPFFFLISALGWFGVVSTVLIRTRLPADQQARLPG